MTNSRPPLSFWLAGTAILLLSANPSRAADTLEAFDHGPSDLELYVCTEGVGLPAQERAHSAEWVLGYGLTDTVSLFVQGASVADGHLGSATGSWAIGGYSTVVDTTHIDLDVGAAVGRDDVSFGYAPFLELNLDLAPDLEVAGTYLVLEPSWYGQQGADGRPTAAFATNAILGQYVTLGEAHQVLLELDGTGRKSPAPEERRWELGALHFGYNVYVSDNVELINEVSADVPQAGDSWSYGAFTGVIATLL